jgi:uncharacterized membrane protein
MADFLPCAGGTRLAFSTGVIVAINALRTALMTLLMLGLTVSASAGNPVMVEITRDSDKAYVVAAAFDVEAPADVAWSVLTDYEGISTFVSSIRQSTIRDRKPGRVVLEQQGVSKVWILSLPMHVVLDVREHEGRMLAFRDVCGKSFTTYEGEWKIQETDGRTRVTYRLTADPAGRQPAMFARPAIRGSVRQLLEEVRAEILTRVAR